MSITNYPDADFTPDIPNSGANTGKQSYNPTGSFRFWAQKVLPTVYDDSLSYYEILTKVVNYLNAVIQNVDSLNDSVDNTNSAFDSLQGYVNSTKDTIISAYNELQSYVNTYFDSLDVQEEINAKLDGMASDGSLSKVVSPFIPSLVSDWLSQNITPTSPAIDASLSISGAGADAKVTGDKFSEVNEEIEIAEANFSKFKKNVFNEEATTTPNLYPSQVLTEETLWNCWRSKAFKEQGDISKDYACFEFEIPSGSEYISANYSWANNSYSAFVTDDYTKIELIKNTKTNDAGYVYAVPQGATKACVSIKYDDGSADRTSYEQKGIVFIVGNEDITNKTKDDYSEGDYFADNLKLASENNETIPEIITSLKITDMKLTNDIGDINSQFDIKENLATGINEGQYAMSWNIGDSVTIGENDKYAYCYADVEGCEYITINMERMSDTFSFFTDDEHKKVSKSADNRIGTSRVYSVPPNAKYFYVSTDASSIWSTNGFVVLKGTEDIATNPANVKTYPYNTKLYFSDSLKLSNGSTIGEMLANTRRIYHVEKDGSGDFTSLVEAINTACKYMDSVVYIGNGEWNLMEEYGSDYMNNVSSDKNTWGMVLKNRVHVIGSSQSVIKCIFTEEEYDRSHPENLPGATVYFSVFNAGEYGFTLENVCIEDSGIRYSVHDDLGGAGSTPCTNKFINCKMIHKNGMYSDCVGGGIGESCYVEIRGCYFEGDGIRDRLAYYHGNNNAQITNAKAHIIVCDNYFADNGTFKLTNYGNSTTESEAYVSNNSFGSAPEITDGSSPTPIIKNMKIIQWNNEIRTA